MTQPMDRRQFLALASAALILSFAKRPGRFRKVHRCTASAPRLRSTLTRWCRPPTWGIATICPADWTRREFGESFSKDRWRREAR